MTALDIALSIALAVASIVVAGPLSLDHGLTARRRSLLASVAVVVPGAVLGVGIVINPDAVLADPLFLLLGALGGTIIGSIYASVKTRRHRAVTESAAPGRP